MRVLHIGKYYPPHRGGIERVLGLLCGAMKTRCELQVICFHDRPETRTDTVDGVLVVRTARWESLFSVPIAPGMYFWMRDRRFDIVHLHTPNPLAELLYLLARPAGRLVVGYHAEPQKAAGLRRLYAPVADRVLGLADAVAVATPRHCEAGTHLHAYRAKCHVIPYGIDVERFRPPQGEDREAEDWRQRIGGDFAVFVGRLVPYKGLLTLMEAFRSLPYRLAIVGSGPLYANLQQLRAGLEDRVHMLGDLPDQALPALLRASRCLVLPSLDRSEAFGMVQLEAFAAARPVVASDLPTGVSWVNRHLETGLLVPPGDSEALGQALQQLFEDDELAARLGAGALARAREHFEADAFGERTMELYRRLLGEGAPA